jgi:hypothetical protein
MAKFKKSVALESNTNRLTLEGALTIAAIGLMVALVLQSEAMAGQNEEMGPENPLSFDSTRTPAGLGPVRFRPDDDLRLKGVAPYAVAEASPFSPIDPLAVDRPFLAPYEPVVGYLPIGSIAAGSGGRAPTGSTGSSGGGGGGARGGNDGGGGGGTDGGGGGPSYGAGTNFGTGAVGSGGGGAAGAGNTGASGAVAIQAPTPSLSYRAFDGPMDGSTAYIDTNRNGFFDPGDWYTYTDDKGFFSIDYVDANRDGSWDPTEALKRADGRTFQLDPNEALQIRVIGGTDTVSESLNRHELITSLTAAGGVVSPMTTLVEGLVADLGLDRDAAAAKVVTILGLDPAIDLASFDPFSATVSGPGADDYRVKAAQLYNLGYIADVVAGEEGYAGLSSLGRNLLQTATGSDGSLKSLDLASNGDLSTFFKGLAGIEVSAGAVDVFTSIANRGNLQIASSGAAGDVLAALNGDRSLDGLSSSKLSDSSFNSSRDLLDQTLLADNSFAEGGAAAFVWNQQLLGVAEPDADLQFAAMQDFLGLPQGADQQQGYTHLPGADIQARHTGETNAYAVDGSATVTTDERVTLIKDARLDYSTQPASNSASQPVLLEATNTHSVSLSAPDAVASADLLHHSRVMDRSSLKMGKGDDDLVLHAQTDLTVSMFEAIDGELDLDVSSIAMNFSQLDMGDGDDVVVLSGEVALQIDAPDDLADLIADFQPEELAMVDSILSGGNGNDTLVVDGAVRSRIGGGAGNDDLYLLGDSLQVTLDGGSGDDRIFGTQCSETILGGSGDDLLFSNGGADDLTGGSGGDIFVLDMDQGVDLGVVSQMSDFEKALISGKTNLDLAHITDFNAMEGDSIALRGSSIGITDRAQDLFAYGTSQADMDKQVLLLSNFNEFFFSGLVEQKEGFALLDDTNMLLQITADQHVKLLGYVDSEVTPANGMVYTTNMGLTA